jgi:choice-of-anchor A domain-containing protein
MRLKEILVLAVVLSASSLVCKADSFGIASGYNLVALGVAASPGHVAVAGNIKDGSEVTGRVAAAGTISQIGTIGANLGSNDPFKADATFNGTTYDLVAGGGFTTGTSINSHGSAFVVNSNGSAFTNGGINFNGGGKLVTAPNADPINFDTLRTSLENESASIGALAGSTVSTKGQNNTTVLTATDPNLDVFNITAAEFANGAIDVETKGMNPTIIINVTGGAVGAYTSGGIFLYNGQQDFSSQLTDKVLFNFPDATTLNTGSGEFAASILAPYAQLTANTLDGTIIVAQGTSLNGEVHNIEFQGTLPPLTPPVNHSAPPVPEPGTLALVGTGIVSVAAKVRRRK